MKAQYTLSPDKKKFLFLFVFSYSYRRIDDARLYINNITYNKQCCDHLCLFFTDLHD